MVSLASAQAWRRTAYTVSCAPPRDGSRGGQARSFRLQFRRLPASGLQPAAVRRALQFRKLSHDYPAQPPERSWRDIKPKGRITVANAADYMARLKDYVAPSLRNVIEVPAQWDPASSGWYDMPWMGPADAPGDCGFWRDPIPAPWPRSANV
jgi:hypothetical protein